LLQNETITISLKARVAADAPLGEMLNRTWLLDSNGERLSNIATAKVTRQGEHVFDCSDIIGKVFDDTNKNGAQDKGEAGIAGAKVATIKGTILTTDKHGRFHIPCAETPADIGANFALKLDEASLPTGFKPTTENPAVARVGAGKMSRLNFGVSHFKAITLRLSDTAFDPKTGAPKAKLLAALPKLARVLAKKSAALEIEYLRGSLTTKIMKRNMRRVEKALKRHWRKSGAQYALPITNKIVVER
jgi:hypothetical protein